MTETSIARRPLWTFHGGIHIPDEKALSNAVPSASAPLPALLVIPLQQHLGAPARILARIGDRLRTGQMLAAPDGQISAAVHASSSGTLIAIEQRPVPHPSGRSAWCAIVETDGEDVWDDPLPPLTDYLQQDPAAIRERIRWAGVVGMGGATFPTSVKLAPGADRKIHTLILNGAECEPYITCDDRLMRERAGRILEGASIMRHLLGATQILIGIEDNKPEAIAALRQALTKTDLEAAIVPIPTRYPSGGEKQLIRILTGREVPTRGIPAQLGIVCQNVATAAAVATAVLAGRPLISRIVTVTGRAIAAPRNLEVRIGTPANALIAHCGGYREPPRKLICGGPMMGFELQHPEAPVTKGVNCLLALTAAESPDPGAALACIRCGRCAEVCPVGLLPQQLYWYARARDLERVARYRLFDCIECGCCAQACPSHIPLIQYYRYAKTAIQVRAQEQRKSEQARERHAAKLERQARQERERQARTAGGERQTETDRPQPPTANDRSIPG